MIRVLYPGSFDPLTKGHMEIIERATNIFDEVVIAILKNPLKKNFFTIEERIEMIKEIYEKTKNIKIVSSNSATVDLALLYECNAILRGLRNTIDFEYEKQLSTINNEISGIDTILLYSKPEHQSISSTSVKELFNLNKSISNYVHPTIEKKMIKKSSF